MIKNKLNTSFGWTTVIFGEIDSFFFFSTGDPVAIRAVGSLNNRSLNRFQLRDVAVEFGGAWWCYHWVISTELKNKNMKNGTTFKRKPLEYHLCKTRCGITSVLLGIKFMISILIHFKPFTEP